MPASATSRADAGVREQHVVHRLQRTAQVFLARCVHAVGVAEDAVHPRLVDRDPAFDAVAVRVEARARIVDERIDGRPVAPAAFVLQRLRQIPVVKRHHGLDAALEQGVDESVVVREAALLERCATGREEPRPRERETVGVDAELAEQRDVVAPASVVVAGDRTEISALAGEGVPDRRPAPVDVHRALDLERRRRYAEKKIVREPLHRSSSQARSSAPIDHACESGPSSPFGPKQSVW